MTRPRSRQAPETAIVKACLLWLRSVGCLAYRNNTGSMRTHGGGLVRFGLGVGSPDIVGVLPAGRNPDGTPRPAGTFLAVETKAGRNKVTIAQASWLDEAARHGAVCVVAYGLDDLARQLGPYLEG